MRAPDSPRYQLSWALYELGTNVVRNVSLPRAARPYLDQLAAQTSQSTLLGILDDDSVLYLDRGESSNGMQMIADAGRRGPLHSTASGKVLLAGASEETLDRVIDKGLRRFTRATVTDPVALRRQLAHVRACGYATAWQENEVGIGSVAVPLRDYTKSAVGCLTLAAPVARLNNRTYRSHLPLLQNAARGIELHLGGATPR